VKGGAAAVHNFKSQQPLRGVRRTCKWPNLQLQKFYPQYDVAARKPLGTVKMSEASSDTLADVAPRRR
jgi:hypothetical protein